MGDRAGSSPVNHTIFLQKIRGLAGVVELAGARDSNPVVVIPYGFDRRHQFIFIYYHNENMEVRDEDRFIQYRLNIGIYTTYHLCIEYVTN